MALWTFDCFLSESGRDLIDDWYLAQAPEVQAAFDTVIRYLGSQPREKWSRPYFSLLEGYECDGIGEIRFKANRVQHRPLGFFGPQRLHFTIVICVMEKGGKLPKGTCRTASKRKYLVENEEGRAHECEF